jgi:dihydrofolate synthase/folylpolyglutamate synthase
VLDARVVALTNVGLDHTDVLGETREQIAAEKLAVLSPGATLVSGEPEWGGIHADDVGRAAAEAFLGHALDGDVEISLPGRFDVIGEDVFAGAHNPAGVEWLLPRLPRDDYVVVASILEDKDAAAMLRLLGRAGRSFVATASANARALDADELARIAGPYFDLVEAVSEPEEALGRARELAGSEGAVLITGSLYLLADLSVRPNRIPWESSARG